MSQWFYSKANQTHGPSSADELKNLAAEGLLQASDIVWPEGSGGKDGRRADAVLDFSRLPRPKPILPTWLDDVAKQEVSGPVPPPPAGRGSPDWLADLRLWYALDMVPASRPRASENLSQCVDDWCNLERLAGAKPPSARGSNIAAPVMAPAPEPTAPPKLPQKPGFPPPVEAPPTADVLAERAIRETGVDPRTGQVLDADQFQKWKQQQAQSAAAAGTPTTISVMELFRQGRIAVEHWVDDDDHRDVVLAGNMTQILKSPELASILQQYGEYGPVLKDKLLKHLAFMVKNRRDYYSACPG